MLRSANRTGRVRPNHFLRSPGLQPLPGRPGVERCYDFTVRHPQRCPRGDKGTTEPPTRGPGRDAGARRKLPRPAGLANTAQQSARFVERLSGPHRRSPSNVARLRPTYDRTVAVHGVDLRGELRHRPRAAAEATTPSPSVQNRRSRRRECVYMMSTMRSSGHLARRAWCHCSPADPKMRCVSAWMAGPYPELQRRFDDCGPTSLANGSQLPLAG